MNGLEMNYKTITRRKEGAKSRIKAKWIRLTSWNVVAYWFHSSQSQCCAKGDDGWGMFSDVMAHCWYEGSSDIFLSESSLPSKAALWHRLNSGPRCFCVLMFELWKRRCRQLSRHFHQRLKFPSSSWGIRTRCKFNNASTQSFRKWCSTPDRP